MSSSETSYYKKRMECLAKTVAVLYMFQTLKNNAVLKVRLKKYKSLLYLSGNLLLEAESYEKELREESKRGHNLHKPKNADNVEQ